MQLQDYRIYIDDDSPTLLRVYRLDEDEKRRAKQRGVKCTERTQQETQCTRNPVYQARNNSMAAQLCQQHHDGKRQALVTGRRY